MRLKLAVAIVLLAVACGSAGGAGGAVGSPLSVDQLKFKVIDAVGVPLFCDPDYYPIAHQGGEESNADTYYPQIRADAELYAAIVAHEHLASGELDEAQKLTLYRAFKRLRALVLTQNSDSYTFEIRVQTKGPNTAVELVDGSVRVDGVVTITSRKPSGMPPCPICLAAGTLIATPSGAVRPRDGSPPACRRPRASRGAGASNGGRPPARQPGPRRRTRWLDGHSLGAGPVRRSAHLRSPAGGPDRHVLGKRDPAIEHPRLVTRSDVGLGEGVSVDLPTGARRVTICQPYDE